MKVAVLNLSLVVLIGPSGSGKSAFARKHFLSTEVLSSDYCRGLVSDDENNQAATKDAFEVLHFIAAKRLAAGRLTVVDATNVQREARQPLVKLAREYHTLPVAIVFNLPEGVCQERNRDRADRDFGRHVIRQQRSQLRQSIKAFKREGFRHIFVMESPEEVDAATIERTPLWNDKRDDHGPFDCECGALLFDLSAQFAGARKPNISSTTTRPIGYWMLPNARHGGSNGPRSMVTMSTDANRRAVDVPSRDCR